MNVIRLNNFETEVESYSKNTYLSGANITSNASCSIITNDVTALNALMATTITSLQILHDGELIYNLQDINAKIENISEYLSNDRMNINLNLNFNGAN